MSSSVEETLAWEAEQRPRAAGAALGAGLLGLLATLIFILATRGGPEGGEVDLVDALDAAARGEDVAPGITVRQVDFLGERATALIASTVLTSLATVAGALAMVYLWRATKARAPELNRIGLVAVVAGALLYAVGYGVHFVTVWSQAAGFADEQRRTAEAAREVFADPTVNAGSLMEIVGLFGLAVGFTLIALNAMRVGLLTRFMGILGILVGVLFVFPVDRPGIVRWFWLLSLGMLIAGRWPNGTPPAWQSGRAEPWPSQQALAERRQAAKAARQGEQEGSEPATPDPTPREPRQGGRRKRRR